MKTAAATLQRNWPEYAIEAAGLGLFMISACAFVVWLEHPASGVSAAIPSGFVRRALVGLAMGLTAISLIYSPWGQRSGAHFNPAVTLTFFRLGKVAPADLVAYVIAQFAGGALGMTIAQAIFGRALAHASVHYVATVPGSSLATAFVAELLIAFLLMTVVLHVSNSSRARLTGLCAGVSVALFITFEAPLSGMSLNPARTFASALFAQDWTALWIYFLAPPFGMLAAATLYEQQRGAAAVACAKLDHSGNGRCLFCDYHRHRTQLPSP